MPCNRSIVAEQHKGEIKVEKLLFTSESVTEGHPDKIADQISDSVLDAILEQDPYARVACETVVNTGVAILVGEITTTAQIDFQEVVRNTIREIGYNELKYGYDADHIAVMVSLDKQSPDIAQGVNNALETRDNKSDSVEFGAGDQGLMFGYASDETDTFMPMPIYLSHQLSYRLAQVRKSGELSYLGPDGKVQVTVEYHEDKTVKRIDTIVISTQHDEDVSQEVIRRDMLEHVVKPIVPAHLLDSQTHYFINPTGKFVIGGPVGDSGLTGRKIIVDTYGGYARHGGGAFSGKDSTKVDRSASYAARYIAKNIVAAGLAKKCEIQLAYAIGVAQPVSIAIDTFGTHVVSEETLLHAIRENFSLTPKGIIEMLDLRKPIFKQTAAYGHFGRKDVDLPWERLDKVDALKAYLSYSK